LDQKALNSGVLNCPRSPADDVLWMCKLGQGLYVVVSECLLSRHVTRHMHSGRSLLYCESHKSEAVIMHSHMPSHMAFKHCEGIEHVP